MNTGAALVLTAGLVTTANEALFAPLAKGGEFKWSDFNWRILPATAVAAALVSGLDLLSPEFATSLGAIALITVLFANLGNAGPVFVNVSKVLGIKTA